MCRHPPWQAPSTDVDQPQVEPAGSDCGLDQWTLEHLRCAKAASSVARSGSQCADTSFPCMCRPLHLIVSDRRFARILEVLTSQVDSIDPNASAQPLSAVHMLEAALARKHGCCVQTGAYAAPRSSLRWLQIRRRKPLPAVRQRQPPRVRACTNIPDWESCGTTPTLQDGSTIGSSVSTGQLERAPTHHQRACPSAAAPLGHARPPTGSPAWRPDAAGKPGWRPSPNSQQAAQPVVGRGVLPAGSHRVTCTRVPGRPSARSDSASSGISSPESAAHTLPPVRWTREAKAVPCCEPAASDDATESSADSDSAAGEATMLPHDRRDSAVRAANQAVSCSSSCVDGLAAVQHQACCHAMVRSKPGASPACSTATAEQQSQPATMHRRTVALVNARASTSESSFSIGASDTSSVPKAGKRRQQAASEQQGIADLSSTSVSSAVAAPTAVPLLLAPRQIRTGRRRAARSERQATDSAPSAAEHDMQLTAARRKRHTHRRTAGTAARRQRSVGHHAGVAPRGRTGRQGTDAWYPASSPVRITTSAQLLRPSRFDSFCATRLKNPSVSHPSGIRLARQTSYYLCICTGTDADG